MKLKDYLKVIAISLAISIAVSVTTVTIAAVMAIDWMYGILGEIELVPQTTVNSNYPLSQEVKDEIRMASSKFKPNEYDYSKPAMFEQQEEYQSDDVEGCSQYCNYLVAHKLSFSFKKKAERKADEENCVGFAAMMTAACNYAFKINGMNAKAYHVRGIVKLHGINLCEKLGKYSSFFKDHDFVVVKYDGKSVIYDPSMQNFNL